MSFFKLPEPDWPALVGGGEDTESWLAARARKLELAADRVPRIFATARKLEANSSVFRCSPAVLAVEPKAALFYLDMLALTPKTLRGIKTQVAAFGCTATAETIANAFAAGRTVSAQNAQGFSDFINAQIAAVLPAEFRSVEIAVGTALLVDGARIQGSVQNRAGTDAVRLLKSLLVAAFEARELGVEVGPSVDGPWQLYAAAADPLSEPFLRFGGRLVCEFTPGGNRPDLKVTLRGVVMAVGEVKGRKDVSNIWESWMPNIAGHLRTWVTEFADAPRLFFGTVITEEMITGLTPGGTQHNGLETFKYNGYLTAVYNLSLVAAGDPKATGAFAHLADALARLVKDRTAAPPTATKAAKRV